MIRKVAILIDGQNLYDTLKHIRLLESAIHWGRFFADLLESDDELMKIYLFRRGKLMHGQIKYFHCFKSFVRLHFPQRDSDWKRQERKIPKDILGDNRDYFEETKRWIESQKIKFVSQERI